MTDETNLAETLEVENVPAEETEQQDESATDTGDADNPEGEADEAEPDTVDLERDGKTYKVPAALKDDFLRQADYTRKTQELSAKAKELDTARERVTQAGEAEINARAKSVAIDAALKQYEAVDWDAVQRQDAGFAFEHWRKFQQLQAGKVEADNEYSSAVQARAVETQQEAAKRLEQGNAEIARSIPDWGPKKAEELMSFGEKALNFSREYMESVTDPNFVKVMNLAFLASKQRPAGTPPAQTAQPAAKVKGGVVPRKGLDDRLSAEDWVAERNRQDAARRNAGR